jgi:cell division septation protein DedD
VVIARTVGIFLALAVLSFVLGFFVLAKVVPGAPQTPAAQSLPATDLSAPVSPDTGASKETPRDAASAREHKDSSTEAASAPGASKPKAARGPTLDPETDGPVPTDSTGVQAPRKLSPDGQASSADRNTAGETATSGDASDQAKSKSIVAVKKKHRRRVAVRTRATDENSSDEATTGSGESTSDTADVPARPRQSRRASTSSDESDGNSDGNAADPDRSGPATKDESAGRGTLYHVRLGAFHTREAADNEVERARAKGFPTKVVPVTHRGHTLYRVQAGAFRDRDRAEAIKQSLQDASLDASVTEQRR